MLTPKQVAKKVIEQGGAQQNHKAIYASHEKNVTTIYITQLIGN